MTQQSLIGQSPVARRVEFVVPGKPVAKGRPRFSRHNGIVRTHTPEEAVSAIGRLSSLTTSTAAHRARSTSMG